MLDAMRRHRPSRAFAAAGVIRVTRKLQQRRQLAIHLLVRHKMLPNWSVRFIPLGTLLLLVINLRVIVLEYRFRVQDSFPTNGLP